MKHFGKLDCSFRVFNLHKFPNASYKVNFITISNQASANKKKFTFI